MVVMGLFTIVPDYIAEKIFEPKSVGLILVKIVLRLIGLVLGMVATRISLDIHDYGQADLSTDRRRSFLKSVRIWWARLFMAWSSWSGLCCLIVPGIIVAYMFLYVGYLIIDRGLGPIAALSESRVVTDGYKMDLFLFSLAVALVNIIGVVCLFVGLFVTIPDHADGFRLCVSTAEPGRTRRRSGVILLHPGL